MMRFVLIACWFCLNCCDGYSHQYKYGQHNYPNEKSMSDPFMERVEEINKRPSRDLLPRKGKHRKSYRTQEGEVITNPCIPNPCKNGGTCLMSSVGESVCLCSGPFKGPLCERHIVQRSSSKNCSCTENEACIYDVGSKNFSCECRVGFTGEDCSVVDDPCSYVKCVHGRCRSNHAQTEVWCHCNKGYQGAFCDKEWSNPCVQDVIHSVKLNGLAYRIHRVPWNNKKYITCFNENLFIRSCPKGQYFSENAKLCKDKNRCNDGCHEGNCIYGHCMFDVKSNVSTCTCDKGYKGKYCEVEINECKENYQTCGMGQCVDVIGGFYCDCGNGLVGNNCTNPFLNPCLNTTEILRPFGSDEHRFVLCDKKQGFNLMACDKDEKWSSEEKKCKAIISSDNNGPCDNNPCYNGGKCTQTGGLTFVCACQPGTAGTYCENLVDHCRTNPCQNGGICRNTKTGYKCLCPGRIIDDCCCHNISNKCSVIKFTREITNKLGKYYVRCTESGTMVLSKCPIGKIWNKIFNVCINALDNDIRNKEDYEFFDLPNYSNNHTFAKMSDRLPLNSIDNGLSSSKIQTKKPGHARKKMKPQRMYIDFKTSRIRVMPVNEEDPAYSSYYMTTEHKTNTLNSVENNTLKEAESTEQEENKTKLVKKSEIKANFNRTTLWKMLPWKPLVTLSNLKKFLNNYKHTDDTKDDSSEANFMDGFDIEDENRHLSEIIANTENKCDSSSCENENDTIDNSFPERQVDENIGYHESDDSLNEMLKNPNNQGKPPTENTQHNADSANQIPISKYLADIAMPAGDTEAMNAGDESYGINDIKMNKNELHEVHNANNLHDVLRERRNEERKRELQFFRHNKRRAETSHPENLFHNYPMSEMNAGKKKKSLIRSDAKDFRPDPYYKESEKQIRNYYEEERLDLNNLF